MEPCGFWPWDCAGARDRVDDLVRRLLGRGSREIDVDRDAGCEQHGEQKLQRQNPTHVVLLGIRGRRMERRNSAAAFWRQRVNGS